MKKFLTLFLFFSLMACNTSYPIQNEISRSQIYYGQSLADLYENFGAPQKAQRFAYGVVMYIFNQQGIISERVEKTVYDCKLRVFVQDDYVIDWDWQGNNCQFQEGYLNSKIRDDLMNEVY